MRAMQFYVVGLSGGAIGVHCERWLCEWQAYLPANSTLLDIERATKAHTHPSRIQRKDDAA